jgi:hypothetical protein
LDYYLAFVDVTEKISLEVIKKCENVAHEKKFSFFDKIPKILKHLSLKIFKIFFSFVHKIAMDKIFTC